MLSEAWESPQILKGNALRLRCPNRKIREEESVHDHHRKKIVWTTFLASKRTFQASGGYQNPIKTKETEIISSLAPIFFGKDKFLTGAGGVRFLQQNRDRSDFKSQQITRFEIAINRATWSRRAILKFAAELPLDLLKISVDPWRR